ncbi:UNVERIFIED_CONTAM: hypothetical protein PYX00_005414 [Menopon gallinae]|uniref:tRNA (uracil-O(2)-)-methyltransferase n=1 Tax=Menopon gallinae TaxID=328185 RepID=A0AAW2HRD7_9NEOP
MGIIKKELETTQKNFWEAIETLTELREVECELIHRTLYNYLIIEKMDTIDIINNLKREIDLHVTNENDGFNEMKGTYCMVRKLLPKKSSYCDKEFFEICIIYYYKTYERLKSKYAKDLIENWKENTDPQKFVFEDIGIASYLLLLWNKGKLPDGNLKMQRFVDLGCGNGLLVYILNSEGHKGVGLDIRKRKIWDTYPSHVILKEEAVTPGLSVYPEADWLIGNHSDELTPWLPIMARRSGAQCQYFVLPCCAYQLNGQVYQRKNSGLSVYHDYIQHVKNISELCEFDTHIDRLRIPSTKRICLVGRTADIPDEKLQIILRNIDSFIQMETQNGAEFRLREAVEPVRNCTRLPKEIINNIVCKIADNLLRHVNIINVAGKSWNQGGTLPLSSLADVLSPEHLKYLKNESKGLQTLIKNHHYVFKVFEGVVRFRSVEEMMEISQRVFKDRNKLKWKNKECWFHENHPDGCPLPEEDCSYAHK